MQLTSEQLHKLHQQAINCYPEECCGLLLGKDDQVVQVWPTDNSWSPELLQLLSSISESSTEQKLTQESRLNRFAISPADILKAQKFSRTVELAIIGIYHSHPDYPAIPSEYDRRIAWDVYSYLIMSVNPQKVTASRSWQLNGDRQFIEEELLILESKGDR